jgi:ribonuclease I
MRYRRMTSRSFRGTTSCSDLLMASVPRSTNGLQIIANKSHMTNGYHLAHILLLTFAPLFSISASQGNPASVPPAVQPKHEAYILELLWWPEYCHDNPQLRYCAGASFQGFVLGAFIPLSDEGQVHKCEAHTESFRPDNQLLRVMPDETLLERQWKLYGACSGLSQTQYFDHLSRVYRSVRIPRDFISPKDHFEISVDQTKEEFLRKNVALSPSTLNVLCRSGFLSKIQIQRDSHMMKRTETCEYPRVKVIARMPLAE